MFELTVNKHGVVETQLFQKMINSIGKQLEEEFAVRDTKINSLNSELKKIKSELEAERRLRLGQSKQKCR